MFSGEKWMQRVNIVLRIVDFLSLFSLFCAEQ